MTKQGLLKCPAFNRRTERHIKYSFRLMFGEFCVFSVKFGMQPEARETDSLISLFF